ncbi:pyrroline-5-carboxylate reductase, putative [Plasmodium ovale curtisi]|uniref:Pyrroline-5-carboxylate reductase n=1 Tax=Plasmodium ovale curtisi TaxID=864141 RepID=A0A1A8WNC8_PLAOA|nr:pyrroline-5-carboxylate reductase, putative [Plasmodium ovale curtisi]
MENIKLGFIGLGQMGSALANGIAKSSVIKKENIYYYSPSKKDTTFNYVNSNVEVKMEMFYSLCANHCDIIICAVKPDLANFVLSDIRTYLPSKLLISICGGLNIGKLEQICGEDAKIAWVMPNTPCLVGEGSFIYCANKNVGEVDKKYVNAIFNACGIIHEIKEKDMDIATAISGCGPAYVYLFIESLIDAGVKNGLTRDLSKKLVLQTIQGSVKMVKLSDQPVQQLKDNICSPGGITAMGLFTLEKNGFKYGIIDAVDAAVQKSKAMGKLCLPLGDLQGERKNETINLYIQAKNIRDMHKRRSDTSIGG